MSWIRTFATSLRLHQVRNKAPVLGTLPTPKIDLPPESEWASYFSHYNILVRDRVSLRNPQTAAAVAESFVPGGSASRDKIVIEAFPGPGALTRALLQLPKERIRKLIVLEDYEPYLEYLRPLEKVDPRIHVIPMRGFSWDTYIAIENIGLLDAVETIPWDGGVHPQLQFISHLPQTIFGEQLIAQLFRCIPDRSWLFKFGRMPMNFVLSDWVWQRISSTTRGPLTRCKLSVIAEAVSDVNQTLRPHALQPYNNHFHPIRDSPSDTKPQRHAGSPCQAINIVPLEHQLIGKGMLDKWDYCLRRLFVLKSKPLKSALSHLAPGSQILIKDITNPDLPDSERIDVKKQIRQLTVAEWAILIKAFDRWPFAPEDLAISDAFGEDQRF